MRLFDTTPILQEFADQLPPGARLLDVGCGAGEPVARYFIEQGDRDRHPLAESVAVQPVRNTWRSGWGIIHRTPHGGLCHGSGGEAVEITLTSGKRFRLGTDEPQQLAPVRRAACTDARLAAA